MKFDQRGEVLCPVEEIQKDLDLHLHFYNTERPHQGYRNMGRRPVDTMEKFIQSSRKKVS